MDESSDGLDQNTGAQRSGTDGNHTVELESAQLREIVSAVPEPVVVIRQSGEIVTGNGEFASLFDQQLSSLVGRQFSALFPDLTWTAIEDNCDADVSEYVTSRGVREQGGDLWVDLTFDSHRLSGRVFYIGTLHDVTVRREREQVLEQYERIVETIEDGVYTLDESFTIQTVNSAVESMMGYDEADLVGESATMLADESVIDRATRLSTELLAGERDAATLTADLQTADGETLPVETRFTTYPLDDGSHRQVGVVRDISDRRRFERTLAALHDSTRELLEAQTTTEVGRIVVAAATDVLEIDGAVIYQFDRPANALCPVVVSEGIAGDPDTQPSVDPGSGPLWDGFVDGKRVSVSAESDPVPDGVSTGGVCLSLGEFGVLYVKSDAVDEHDADTIEVLELLAASAEAALARVDREQALRERDEKLRERNSRLKRLEEVNTIIRSIDQVLVDADTCDEIEQAVCDQLAASRGFSFAWIGRLDGTELEPRAWAGDSPSYLDAVSLTTGDSGPPAVRTAQRETTTVDSSIADGLQDDHWRAEAVAREFQSVISIPLQYEEFTDGVLTVYATEQAAFEEMLQSVFAELGETIASAIRDVESRQRQSAATTLELEVAISAPTSPLGKIVDRIGTTVVCEGVVPQAGDETRLFFRLADEAETIPPAVIRERASELTCVESLTVITDDDVNARFETVVSGGTVAQTLVDQGARIVSIRVSEGRGPAVGTVRLSAGVDVRRFVDRLDERYEDAQLRARRECDVSDQTGSGARTALETELTDRQLQVLRTAYFSGFFEWPRKSTGQDLAERLDVSQPTVSRHLRVGERKLLEFAFEEG
ncbi:bacterio-opsin activator [Halobacteriales archaeon QS_4_62_28]|nr:MAG: bacterio-opsin activator [Halobacteriales archaeon QS_4_62_28]